MAESVERKVSILVPYYWRCLRLVCTWYRYFVIASMLHRERLYHIHWL